MQLLKKSELILLENDTYKVVITLSAFIVALSV